VSLVNCPDCGREVSEQASACVNCGRPLGQKDSTGNAVSLWAAVTKTKTPINVFALAMTVCASVLAHSATNIESCYASVAFTYTIHAFLAVSGMFFLAILFCRNGVYHPRDLEKIDPAVRSKLGEDRPIAAAVLISLMLFGYGLYQYNADRPCVQAPPPGVGVAGGESG